MHSQITAFAVARGGPYQYILGLTAGGSLEQAIGPMFYRFWKYPAPYVQCFSFHFTYELTFVAEIPTHFNC